MNLGTSLIITLVGMGLVFGALLLLWGLMELIVRLTQETPAKEDHGDEMAGEVAVIEAPQKVFEGLDGKQRAAAAAVAVALAAGRQQAAAVAAVVAMAVQQQSSASSSQEVFEPPVMGISAWQAVLRAGQYNQRSTKSQR